MKPRHIHRGWRSWTAAALGIRRRPAQEDRLYMQLAPFATERKALVLGAGHGFGASRLRLGGAREVLALDPSEVRVAVARRARPVHALELRNGPLMPPEETLGSFDVILCDPLAGPAAPDARLSAWAARHLSPGGRVLVLLGSPASGLRLRSGDRTSCARWTAALCRDFLLVRGTTSGAAERAGGGSVGPPRLENLKAPDDDADVLVAELPRQSTVLPLRLNVGSGSDRREGWVNVDVRPFPGVDVVADVTQELPFSDVAAVYAEHFLEHLELAGAVRFLGDVHRALAADGWLRLSTPNLEWVWRTHYVPRAEAAEKVDRCLMLNRAFYGWEHRFLWNRELLERALAATGFTDLRWCRHGESEVEHFRDAERHERYGDTPELPHVLVVEGRKGAPQPTLLEGLRQHLGEHFLRYVQGY